MEASYLARHPPQKVFTKYTGIPDYSWLNMRQDLFILLQCLGLPLGSGMQEGLRFISELIFELSSLFRNRVLPMPPRGAPQLLLFPWPSRFVAWGLEWKFLCQSPAVNTAPDFETYYTVLLR
jgi:hypothetical protein